MGNGVPSTYVSYLVYTRQRDSKNTPVENGRTGVIFIQKVQKASKRGDESSREDDTETLSVPSTIDFLCRVTRCLAILPGISETTDSVDRGDL